MGTDTTRGTLKKQGAEAAKTWLSTASTGDIVRLAGYDFDYGLDTLDDLREQCLNVPSSSDEVFSWGFYKQVKSHVCHKVHFGSSRWRTAKGRIQPRKRTMSKREEKKDRARWYQDNIEGLYAVVRQIIDNSLATQDRVSIYYVREMLHRHIRLPFLNNIAVAKGKARNDVSCNLRIGSEALARDFLRAHRAAYIVKDNWICAGAEHRMSDPN